MQHKIDETARTLAAAGTSRRGAVKTLFAAALGAFGLANLADAEAKGGKGKRGGKRGKGGKGGKGGNNINYVGGGGGGNNGYCQPGAPCYQYDNSCGDGCTCVFETQGAYEGKCETTCDPSYCPCGCDDYTNACIPEYECPGYCQGTCSYEYPDCGDYCQCDYSGYCVAIPR